MLESGAIVHWLADRDGDHLLAPPLESPSRRAYEQWSFFAVTNLEEPAWQIVLHRDILPAEAAVKAIIPFAERRLAKMLERLEGELGSGTRTDHALRLLRALNLPGAAASHAR